jgi:DNA repair exonuclease SbcCD ATPase subunit
LEHDQLAHEQDCSQQLIDALQDAGVQLGLAEQQIESLTAQNHKQVKQIAGLKEQKAELAKQLAAATSKLENAHAAKDKLRKRVERVFKKLVKEEDLREYFLGEMRREASEASSSLRASSSSSSTGALGGSGRSAAAARTKVITKHKGRYTNSFCAMACRLISEAGAGLTNRGVADALGILIEFLEEH